MFSESQKKEIYAIILALQGKSINAGKSRTCCISSLFNTEDTQSIALLGNLTDVEPLKANIKLSSDVGNSAEIRADGLWVAGDGGTFYTDEQARDAVGAMFNVSEFSVDDALNTIALNQVPYSKVTGVPAFLTAETDPIFSASVASTITGADKTAWNNAVVQAANVPTIISDLNIAEQDIIDNNIVSAAFTGTTTKTLTLTKGDATVITADFSDTGLNDTIYAVDGTLAGNRIVEMAGLEIVWNNNGLFRIKEGDTSVGALYDFNNGVDFLNFNATYSMNIKQDVVSGVTLSVVDVPSTNTLFALDVKPDGIRARNLPEHADNAAAILAGLTAGYLYRTGDNLKVVH